MSAWVAKSAKPIIFSNVSLVEIRSNDQSMTNRFIINQIRILINILVFITNYVFVTTVRTDQP